MRMILLFCLMVIFVSLDVTSDDYNSCIERLYAISQADDPAGRRLVDRPVKSLHRRIQASKTKHPSVSAQVSRIRHRDEAFQKLQEYKSNVDSRVLALTKKGDSEIDNVMEQFIRYLVEKNFQAKGEFSLPGHDLKDPDFKDTQGVQITTWVQLKNAPKHEAKKAIVRNLSQLYINEGEIEDIIIENSKLDEAYLNQWALYLALKKFLGVSMEKYK